MIAGHFDWPTVGALAQALSGAVVGGFAVLGAYKIGLRQVGITEKQTDILAKQLEIESRRLSHELYERRYKTYDASTRYLIECVNSNDLRPNPETLSNFQMVFWESRFLHKPEVEEGLKELQEKVEATYSLRRKISQDIAEDLEYDGGDLEKEIANQDWMHERAKTLPALFSDLVLS